MVENLDERFNSDVNVREEPYESIEFTVVEDKDERRLFKDMIDDYHVYKNFKQYPGRQIRWLIFGEGEVVGGIGIASSPMHLGDRDKYIGWSHKQKMANLNKIAINYRFCLKDLGFGSQILSKFYYVAKQKWEDKYGDKLVLLETMVKPPWDGTVYRASGWDKVGRTKGVKVERPPSKALYKQAEDGSEGDAHKERAKMVSEGGYSKARKKYGYISEQKYEKNGTVRKLIFCKPLHRYWRKELTRL